MSTSSTISKNVLRILIIHPNLKIGGAESQIKNLIREWSEDERFHITLVLYDAIDEKKKFITDLYRARVIDLERRSVGRFRSLVRLFKISRKLDADIVYSLLVGPNIFGVLVHKGRRGIKIVWGNRVSWFRRGEFGLKGWVTAKLEKAIVNNVDLIISNSESGRAYQHSKNMCGKRNIVIPNGIDTEKYKKKEYARARIRAELQLLNDDILIGLVARIVEWKGYELFLQSAALLEKRRPNEYVKFVCIGDGEPHLVEKYKKMTETYGIDKKVIWLGARDDVENLLNGIDILSLVSTSGEGFSNVIGEGMATQKAVVVTDVGDNRRVVGNAGIIIEPGDSDGLFNAWGSLIDDKNYRENLGELARRRVEEEFSIEKMARETKSAFFDIIK